MKPTVLKQTLLSIQVCVPEAFNETEVKAFADREVECGTTNGWHVRQDDVAAGYRSRVDCAERRGFVHVVLDA